MAENNELLKPSIPEDFEPTKSFSISWFSLIGLFLGVICMALIGTRNAKWLKIKSCVIYGMLAACILVFVSKYIVLFLAYCGAFGFDAPEHLRLIKNVFRALYLLVSFCYYFLLKGAYQKHMYTVRTTEPFKPYLLRYGAISIAGEVVMSIVIAGMVVIFTGAGDL